MDTKEFVKEILLNFGPKAGVALGAFFALWKMTDNLMAMDWQLAGIIVVAIAAISITFIVVVKIPVKPKP